MKTSMFFGATLVAVSALSVSAQNLQPEIFVPIPGEQTIISKISDNGLWGISEKASTTDGDLRPTGGTLFNLVTLEKIPIVSSTGLGGVSDVTDDGKIVVGECNGLPAYWNLDTQAWTFLPLYEGYNLGRVNCVTPDGKYGAGYISSTADEWKAYPVMWDLVAKTIIEDIDPPIYDMQHVDQDQNVFYGVSPDGRYLLGYMSMSYVYPPQICCYVYDRQEGTYDFIGFTPDDAKPWTPDVPNTYFISEPAMSNNGLWVTGSAYMVTQIPGSEWPLEEQRPFRYNVLTKEIEILQGAEAASTTGFSIGDNGFLYMATPAGNPYATAVFQKGDFMVSLDQIFKQVYGVDFQEVSGFPVSGKPISISDDGLTIVMIPTTDATYVLRLKEPIEKSLEKVRLLADYTVAPAGGNQLSKLNTITLNFERDIIIKGAASKIKFTGDDGSSYSPLSSNGFVADGKKVTLTFRSRDLNPDTKYTLTIPDGMILLKGDNSVTAGEIKVEYQGRANTPVQMVSSVPEDGNAVPYLDYTGNPLLLTFDTDIKLGENLTGFLYVNTDELPISTLSIACYGKQAIVFPPVRQNLYDGSEYDVLIPAGAVTDVSGGGPNEEIKLHFIGNYVRTVSTDDKYLFNEDCGTTENFLFYEGDHNNPDPVASSWGFTKDTPWYYVCDENSTDMALASHSMYKPAGKSDDWMMTTQLNIPDEKCYLEFDAQSYYNDCDDYLTVYAFEADEVYNTLTAATIERIRQEGKVIFHELLSPGAEEEILAGDWTNYVVKLPEYAGKNIYIAFLNEMDDQSAIFIDNIRVVHDLSFLTSIDTATRMVNQDEAIIKGAVTIASDIDSYDSILMRLIDNEGTLVSKIEESGIELKQGKPYNFSFPEPLKLEKAVVNKYKVEVTLGENTTNVPGEIRNLTFQPYRKIVLEEFNGSECSNCPLGIRAIENIQELYPGSLLPICVRTYSNDKLGAGMGSYSAFLGMQAAPSARIDRGPICMPMISVDMDYMFSGASIVDPETGTSPELWLDVFRKEYASPSDLGLSIESKLDKDAGTIDVKTTVTSALNMDRTAYNLFAVVIENDIVTYQLNGFSSVKDPDLGEWGYGGKYGQSTVFPAIANDVARATWGTTFNGTGGLIPTTLAAGQDYESNFTITLPETISNLDNCEVIVMIIDAATERVVNANICELNGVSGVEEIFESPNAQIGLTVVGNTLMVNGEDFNVQAYDLTGMPLVNAKGNGLHAYSLGGYNGVIIVKATDANGMAVTRKFIVK